MTTWQFGPPMPDDARDTRVLSAAECSRLERDAELMLILWHLRIRRFEL